MEAIKPTIGYKQTEIGLIPEEWEVVRLGEIAKTLAGGSAPQDSKYFGGKNPFVRVQHIGNENYRIIACDFITDEAVKKYRLKLFPKGTILFPKSGATVYLEKRAMLPFDAYIVSHLCAVNSKNDKSSQEFLFYALLKTKFAEKKGDGYPTLNLSEIRQFFIPLPPLPEQRRIATVLSTIQRAIEQQDKIIETTKKLKKSLMHTLFTKGLNGEAQKETEIGRVPKSWEVVRLGEIGDSFIGGGTPSTKKLQYWDGKIPWITSAYITGLYITDGQRYISQEGLANSSTNLIPKNNVLIGTRVGVGKIAINLIDVAINQDLTGMIVDKQKANLKFVAYVLSSNGIQEEFRNMRRGTTIKGITREDLKRIKVPFPPLEAQHQIAHILSTVDNKIDVEERRKATLKELFKTMLHKLMTGEIRLNKMEI